MGESRNLIVARKMIGDPDLLLDWARMERRRGRHYFAACKYATMELVPVGPTIGLGTFSSQVHHQKINEDAMGNKDKRKEKKKPKQPKDKPKAGQSKSGVLAPSR
jgi:hypothetical protein